MYIEKKLFFVKKLKKKIFIVFKLYKHYLETMIQSSSDTQKTNLKESNLFIADSAGYFDSTSKEGAAGKRNDGFIDRNSYFNGAKTVKLMAKLPYPVYWNFF